MPRWLDKKHVPLIISLILGNLLFVTLHYIRATGYLVSIEFTAYDLMLSGRPSQLADDRIIVIGESEADLRRFGHPLSDDILAQILERLSDYGAWSVGMDKYRDIPTPPGSERLNTVLSHNPDITWIFNTDIPPPSFLAETDQIALNSIIPDEDGIVRRGILFMDYGPDSVGYSFALMLALRYLQRLEIYPVPDEKVPEHMRLGDNTFIPFVKTDGSYVNADDKGYQFLLDYVGMPNAFKSYTLSELMDGKVKPEDVKGKIVIFGAMAESLNDFFSVPFKHDKADGGLRKVKDNYIYGVELHGYITSQILRLATKEATTIRTFTNNQELGWLWLWSMIGTALAVWIHSAVRFLIAVFIGSTLIVWACYLALISNWWIPVAPAVLGFFLSATLVTSYLRSQQKAERQMIMQLFERHVSSDVVETIWEERDKFLKSGRLMPRRVTATVLFTDIKGFTSVSEKMDAQQLMEWLNSYMEHMTEVVIEHKGTVNKFIGDAIMALFGVPLYKISEEDIGNDARNAVDCALAMSEELENLNTTWREQDLPGIGMRVGIFTGPLVAGSVGSSKRLEFTVIGDTVNTASRLESYKRPMAETELHPAEQVTCRILIGENTRKYLDDSVYKISHYGKVLLKGKAEEVDIHWVEGKHDIQRA